ncbi:endolytic transglycosylase MltG [Levilactobacillus bambusae]|uniref:Endolytic murein transglycosylase n=1 Tax=Levilactobacillus bambusae TaxID=2024736 RepID=A0A2V1N5C1_9LACO|nr:endolytic transglycosylase MltG [Levilactobacillus bambusae]PWG01006.1 endolytic transglycosylase MltG [Levilactobacillus bambusae]
MKKITVKNGGNNLNNGTEPTPPRSSGSQKGQKSPMKRMVLWVIGLLIALVVVLGIVGYRYFQESLQPLDKDSDKVVQVYIPLGASNNKIGSILQHDGIVKSGTVFNYYVKSNNISNFRAGYYQLKSSMTLKTVAQQLERGGSAEPIQSTKGKVLVREGEGIKDIAAGIPVTTDFTKDEFLALMKNKQFINSLAVKYPDLLGSAMKSEGVRYRLEGYLAPATYTVEKKGTLKQLVTEMVAKRNEELKPYFKTIQKKDMTVQEVLTLGSLIEREGVTKSDRRKISGVFLNRINANMPLQSDISILYALDKTKKTVTYKDLKVDSPYNLYVNSGFGPGPFNNPSMESILDVIHPSDVKKGYYYFIANTKTGKVHFSKTYAEHQKWTKKYEEDNK